MEKHALQILITGACAVLSIGVAHAQSRCVQKEFAQLVAIAKTPDGRHNMPLDYCVADLRQSQFPSSSVGYAECASEKEKIKDALLTSGQAKLLKYAESGCQGAHPLAK